MGHHNRGNNSCVYTVPDNQVSIRANSGHYLSYNYYLLFLSIIAIDPNDTTVWYNKGITLR